MFLVVFFVLAELLAEKLYEEFEFLTNKLSVDVIAHVFEPHKEGKLAYRTL